MESLDEDWFYESITRYKNLNMFELELPVQQVELAGANSICVACSNSKRHQLLELSLPMKLLSQAKYNTDNSITSSTDLKIKCGTFTEAKCFQMKTIDDNKVIVSHSDTKGVSLYSLSAESDQIKKETFNVHCHLESPMIAVNDSLLCLTKKRADQMLLLDINTEKDVYTFKIDERVTSNECDERIVPVFLQPDVVALGRQITGGVCIADRREPGRYWFLECPENNPADHSFWSFTSLFECSKEFENTGSNICYAKVSSSGRLLVYDTRNTRQPAYINTNIGLRTEKNAPMQVRFKPCNKDWVSVSGFDGNVHVYELPRSEKPKLVFSHDGHKHVEGHSSETVTTSHVWSKLHNLLISSAENGTIQMWEFENKK